jgi:phosphoribosylformylglycinamidine synthase subunit PurL
MLGLLDDYTNKMTLDFKEEGDIIYLIGETKEDISSSEYLIRMHDVKYSPAPYFDLDTEVSVQNTVAYLIKNKMIQSAHDVSEGGVFVTLMESGMPRTLGFDIETDATMRKDAFLFGESQSRVVVSVKPSEVPYFEEFMNTRKADFSKLGRVLGERIRIDGEGWGNITTWKVTYDNILGTIMEQD